MALYIFVVNPTSSATKYDVSFRTSLKLFFFRGGYSEWCITEVATPNPPSHPPSKCIYLTSDMVHFLCIPTTPVFVTTHINILILNTVIQFNCWLNPYYFKSYFVTTCALWSRPRQNLLSKISAKWAAKRKKQFCKQNGLSILSKKQNMSFESRESVFNSTALYSSAAVIFRGLPGTLCYVAHNLAH